MIRDKRYLVLFGCFMQITSVEAMISKMAKNAATKPEAKRHSLPNHIKKSGRLVHLKALGDDAIKSDFNEDQLNIKNLTDEYRQLKKELLVAKGKEDRALKDPSAQQTTKNRLARHVRYLSGEILWRLSEFESRSQNMMLYPQGGMNNGISTQRFAAQKKDILRKIDHGLMISYTDLLRQMRKVELELNIK